MKLKESITAAGLKPGGVCTVAEIIGRLTKQDAADLVECLADRGYTHAQISRGLATEGHKVSSGVVQRHRNLGCACAQ